MKNCKGTSKRNAAPHSNWRHKQSKSKFYVSSERELCCWCWCWCCCLFFFVVCFSSTHSRSFIMLPVAIRISTWTERFRQTTHRNIIKNHFMSRPLLQFTVFALFFFLNLLNCCCHLQRTFVLGKQIAICWMIFIYIGVLSVVLFFWRSIHFSLKAFD